MSVVDIGTRRELFVDDSLIEKLSTDAERRLHHPQPREVILEADDPWERNPHYITVFEDDDRYRMYYHAAMQSDVAGVEDQLFGLGDSLYCYAESPDGIHWTKPDLGLIAFNGTTDNNIVWKGKASHGFSPFKDTRPDCPPDERYKALGKSKTAVAPEFGGPDDGPRKYLFALKSSDGLNWSVMAGPKEHGAIFDADDGDFDSQNVAFWDETASRYRCYFRKRREVATRPDLAGRVDGDSGYDETARVRDIRTATSSNFLDWSEPEFLTYPEAPAEELYTNQIIPYYRAPHILLGFPTRYVEERGTLTEWHEQMAEDEPGRLYTSYTDGLLMSSRDGRTFNRWGEAFLRPGMPEEYMWGYGACYQNWGIVETNSDIPGAPNELSFYAGIGSDRGDSEVPHESPPNAGIRRYTLRLDGFVSVNTPLSGGEVLTKPLTFEGDRLVLNMATSAAGGIRVELQHPGGDPVEGFELDECSPVYGNAVERDVTWSGSRTLEELVGQAVRLRFVMSDADLYAVQFTG